MPGSLLTTPIYRKHFHKLGKIRNSLRMNVNRFKFESCIEKSGRLVFGRVLNVVVHKLKLHVFVFQKILVGTVIYI